MSRNLTKEQIDAVKPKYKYFTKYRKISSYPWYARSPLLHYLVQWVIYWSLFFPWLNGKYKVGDKVRYNWMAHVQIHTVIERKKNPVMMVSEIRYSDNLTFEDGTGCASFWIRKAYFWEKGGSGE